MRVYCPYCRRCKCHKCHAPTPCEPIARGRRTFLFGALAAALSLHKPALQRPQPLRIPLSDLQDAYGKVLVLNNPIECCFPRNGTVLKTSLTFQLGVGDRFYLAR